MSHSLDGGALGDRAVSLLVAARAGETRDARFQNTSVSASYRTKRLGVAANHVWPEDERILCPTVRF